jgi:hypothetical protein
LLNCDSVRKLNGRGKQFGEVLVVEDSCSNREMSRQATMAATFDPMRAAYDPSTRCPSAISAPFGQGLTTRGVAWAVGIPRHLKVYPVGVKLIWPVAGRGHPPQASIQARLPTLTSCPLWSARQKLKRNHSRRVENAFGLRHSIMRRIGTAKVQSPSKQEMKSILWWIRRCRLSERS